MICEAHLPGSLKLPMANVEGGWWGQDIVSSNLATAPETIKKATLGQINASGLLLL